MKRRCKRRINHNFKKSFYKPRAKSLRNLEEINLSFEELESLRLRYIEKMKQNEAADKMGISQSQYQRDLTVALEKITDALINSKALSIDKNYEE